MNRAYSTSASRFGSCRRLICRTDLTRLVRGLIKGIGLSFSNWSRVLFGRGGSDSHVGGWGSLLSRPVVFPLCARNAGPEVCRAFVDGFRDRGAGAGASVGATAFSAWASRWPRSCDTRQRAELLVGERQDFRDQRAGRVARGRPGCRDRRTSRREPF